MLTRRVSKKPLETLKFVNHKPYIPKSQYTCRTCQRLLKKDLNRQQEAKSGGLHASNKPKPISDPREQFENQGTKAVFSNTPIKAAVVTMPAQASTSSDMQAAQLNETPTGLLPIQHLKDFIKDSIDDLRDEFMNENFTISRHEI